MSTSRRTVLTAAGAGIALSQLGPDAGRATGASTGGPAVQELVRQSAEANAALMRGDIERYQQLVRMSEDFTLMSPFGGTPSRAADYTPERMEAMGRFFRNGTFEQEVVETWGSADMVVLALIERTNVEVGGLPAQDWALRVTLVYRREGERWRLAHRHADPLVAGITHEQAAALAG
jgi:ketosteroid isomerase-like protein